MSTAEQQGAGAESAAGEKVARRAGFVYVPEQRRVVSQLEKVLGIFARSRGRIRPHFILGGPSGSGKSHTIQYLAAERGLQFYEVNAAAITKEGTSGNSLTKALSVLINRDRRPTVVFVDEFDKLFISGNTNEELAHETTNGVQNEFLRVLEAKTAAVFGDYGKYINVPVADVLFIFAGAFNGEAPLSIGRLKQFGIKTEFLGRVGLVYTLPPLRLETMRQILEESDLLTTYLKLYTRIERETAVEAIFGVLADIYEQNTLGIRLINTLIHQYFINEGKLPDPDDFGFAERDFFDAALSQDIEF